MNQVGGSGASGADGLPPQHQQMVGLGAMVNPQLVALRDSTRKKILEYAGRKAMTAEWRRRLPELSRRLERILFEKYPNKSEYYNMTKGPIEPHMQFAIKTLLAQSREHGRNQQMSRQRASSTGYGTAILTPGITQGEAPNEHVNTLLSLGMNSRHGHSRVSSNGLVMTVVDTPETSSILATPAPVKEVPKESKFSCPVCMSELVDASSTICGHIFCQMCIKASIQAQKKCPTCRKKLNMNNFHRVYLPTMD